MSPYGSGGECLHPPEFDTVSAERLLGLFGDGSELPPTSEVRQLFTDLHASDVNLPAFAEPIWQALNSVYPIGCNEHGVDWLLDKLVGVDINETEPLLNDYRRDYLNEQYPGERFWFNQRVWTPYSKIRGIVQALDLTADDVLYDLGSGYGRMPLYAGLTTEAQCKGIEAVPERVHAAKRSAEQLNLTKVEFKVGNVLDQDFSDGTVFYLFWPFSDSTHNKVFDKLHALASKRPIRIAFRGPDTKVSPWFKEIPLGDSMTMYSVHGIHYYEQPVPRPARKRIPFPKLLAPLKGNPK